MNTSAFISWSWYRNEITHTHVHTHTCTQKKANKHHSKMDSVSQSTFTARGGLKQFVCYQVGSWGTHTQTHTHTRAHTFGQVRQQNRWICVSEVSERCGNEEQSSVLAILTCSNSCYWATTLLMKDKFWMMHNRTSELHLSSISAPCLRRGVHMNVSLTGIGLSSVLFYHSCSYVYMYAGRRTVCVV